MHTCHGRGWRHRGGGVRSSVTAASLFCGVDLKQLTSITIKLGILPCSHPIPHSMTTTVHTTTMKQNKKHTSMPKQYLTLLKCFNSDRSFCCDFYGVFYVMDKPEGQHMCACRQESCITESSIFFPVASSINVLNNLTLSVLVHAELFWQFHNPPNSDMDNRIFQCACDFLACV